MSYSAGLLKVGTLNVPGASGSITATTINVPNGTVTTNNLNSSNLAIVENNLSVGGDLSIKGNQYTYDTSFCYITLGVNHNFRETSLTTIAGAYIKVKVELNKVGNQVTLNFPTINFYIPQLSSAGSIVTKSAGYLATTGNSIPEGYRPSSIIYQGATAPNGTVMTQKRSGPCIFYGSISENILTVTQVLYGSPLVVGQIISTTSADSSGNSISAAAGVFISAYGTGKTGKGTYYLNNASGLVINNYTPMKTQTDDFSNSQINMPNYLVQITPTGQLLVTGSASNTQNAYATGYSGIPVGINTILPFSMSYTVNPVVNISNIGINLNSTSVNVINTANWPDCSGFHTVDCSGYSNFFKINRAPTNMFGLATRDNQLMDTFNGNKYNVWTDNSVQSNLIAYPLNDASGPFSSVVTDMMFRKTDSSGNLGPILQLTDNTLFFDSSSNYRVSFFNKMNSYTTTFYKNIRHILLFGTAVSVNKIYPNNVVAQYAMVFDTSGLLGGNLNHFNSVSFDGGITWPTQYNNVLNAGPQLNARNGLTFGDDRGVICDMYGTFWWTYGRASDFNKNNGNAICFNVSPDGVTWYTAYLGPSHSLSTVQNFDSQTFSFGYDGANAGVNTTVSGTQTLNCVDGSGNLTVGNTLNVVSATAFPTTGSFTVTDSNSIKRTIWYTGKTSTSFTGCIVTDTFTSVTLNSSSVVQCLGQYGMWIDMGLPNNYYGTNYWASVVWFLPITGPWANQQCTFTGYFGDGTGTDLSGCSNILTVTGISSGSLVVGQKITGQNLITMDSSNNQLPWYNIVDPSTTITSIIDGSHCTVSVPQNVASQTCYAAIIPLGPSATISGVTNKTVSISTYVSPSLNDQDEIGNVGTVYVNNTTGVPAIGTFVVANDTSGYCTISYKGTTPTSFLNCSVWFNGVGGGFNISVGKSISIPNSPGYLTSYESISGAPVLVTTNDGRVFIKNRDGFMFYKSIPNTTYPDTVQSNWVGPINAGQGTAAASGCNTMVYDDARQTLYNYIYDGVINWTEPDIDNLGTLYFQFSRDNGFTWSKPIIISTNLGDNPYNTAAYGILNSTISLDKVTGNLSFGFYNQAAINLGENLNYQYSCLTIPSSQIDSYLSGVPIVNTTYIVPPAVTPRIGGLAGTYGMLIIPQS